MEPRQRPCSLAGSDPQLSHKGPRPFTTLAPLRECVEQERALSSIYEVGIADPVILSAGRGFVGSLPPGVPAAPGDSHGDACGPLVRVIF